MLPQVLEQVLALDHLALEPGPVVIVECGVESLHDGRAVLRHVHIVLERCLSGKGDG